MGVFRQPPSPFLGGRQPLAPEQLTPAITAVTVNDPPFTAYSRSPRYTAVAVCWIPPPPLPFIGGQQPLAPRLLPPSVTAAQVDNPPFGQYTRTQVAEYTAMLNAWLPPAPLPYQGARTSIVSVDNPPFGLRRPLYVDLSTLQPVQRRNAPPAGVQVDNPPPFVRQAIPGAGPPPQPTQGRKLAPVFLAVAVDNPPVKARPQHLYWLQWQTVPPPIQRRNWFVSESAGGFHSPPAYVPGSSQLGQMYLGAAVLGVANAVPLVASGSSFTISGQFGAIQTAMTVTTGNEDVDIDSTFGPITTSFAITMQGTTAAISGTFGPITTVFRADTAPHTAASITGLFGPITSAFRVTATQPTPRVLPGGVPKSLLNFRPDRKSYKEEEEEETPEQVEEPVAASVPLTPEQQAVMDEQAQIAAAHEHLRQIEQAKQVMRAKHAAMLALLSQL